MDPIKIPVRAPVDPVEVRTRDFRKFADGRYQLTALDERVILEISRLRWQHGELCGRITVRCSERGVPTIDGFLHLGNFNLDSPPARMSRANLLKKLARTSQVEWLPLIEELCTRVCWAEDLGDGGLSIAEIVERDEPDDFDIDGFIIPRRDLSCLVADGGKGKSGVALYVAGRLEIRAVKVLYVDYETDDQTVMKRLRRMFGRKPAGIYYWRAKAPFINEVDALARFIIDKGIQFAVLDSLIPACHGPAEESSTAAALLRTQRATQIGWLNIAHVSKMAERGYEKPFGSQTWFNGPRSVWTLESRIVGNRLLIALRHRKSNSSARYPPVGFEFAYGSEITVTPIPCPNVDEPEPHDAPAMWQRMVDELRTHGQLTRAELEANLNIDASSIRQVLSRDAKNGHKLFLESKCADGIERVRLTRQF